MLDLKQLENSLDEALEAETKASINEFLDSLEAIKVTKEERERWKAIIKHRYNPNPNI